MRNAAGWQADLLLHELAKEKDCQNMRKCLTIITMPIARPQLVSGRNGD